MQNALDFRFPLLCHWMNVCTCAAAVPIWICHHLVWKPKPWLFRGSCSTVVYKLWWSHKPRVTVGYQELILPCLIPLTHTHTHSDIVPHQPMRYLTFDPRIQIYYISCIPGVQSEQISWLTLYTHWRSVAPRRPSSSPCTSWSASQDERAEGDSGGTVSVCACVCVC